MKAIVIYVPTIVSRALTQAIVILVNQDFMGTTVSILVKVAIHHVTSVQVTRLKTSSVLYVKRETIRYSIVVYLVIRNVYMACFRIVCLQQDIVSMDARMAGMATCVIKLNALSTTVKHVDLIIHTPVFCVELATSCLMKLRVKPAPGVVLQRVIVYLVSVMLVVRTAGQETGAIKTVIPDVYNATKEILMFVKSAACGFMEKPVKTTAA